MDHKPGIALVDPHAEGVGGDHHAPLAFHEQILVFLAFARRQLAVIDGGALAGREQFVQHLLGRLDGGGVDDAEAVRVAHQAQRGADFFARIGHLDHAVMQVRPVNAGIDDVQLRTAQLLADVGHHVGRGGGCQRQHRRAPDRLDRSGHFEVGRAEVVAPVRDAMGLVDDDQRDVDLLEDSEELGLGQPLRGAKHDLVAAAADALQCVLLLVGGQAAVDLGGVDADLVQLFELVLHQ